jgi:hypothetical protein
MTTDHEPNAASNAAPNAAAKKVGNAHRRATPEAAL